MSAPKGRRTGRCTICSHEHRYRMELLLVSGAGRRAVARQFGVSPDAVWRHGRAHISQEQRAQILGGPLKLRELATKAAEENLSLIEYTNLLRSSALTRYFAATEAADGKTADLLLGRLTDLMRLQGQFTGDLAKTTIGVQNNTQINLTLSPEFASFQADLIRILSAYPDACQAVVAEFQRLETAHPVQVPALEHQRATAA